MTYIMKEYDEALKTIFEQGWDQKDRTGVGCRSYFGLTTKYNIKERVPLLTYRKIIWKSFVKEVLWYISGSDLISDLQKQGCNVWTPWIDNNFTNRCGFEETSIGYGYGMNLIHFGGTLNKIHSKRGGFNQLDYVIDTLKNNPSSKRAMFIMWRPDKLNEVRLPSCHFAYQFMVSPNENGEMKNLTCQIFQRSNDYTIGVGSGNLFIGALFTYMIAQQCDLVPFQLIHSGSHCHIYHNALEQTETYLDRVKNLEEKNSPILKLNKKPSIYEYTVEDFEIEDYNPYSSIKMPIAV